MEAQQFKPYYAVIFTTLLSNNTEGYEETAKKMEALAKTQKGYLGIVSARNEIGITISYWDSLEAINNWRTNTEHKFAQQKGKSQWYHWYNLKICKVEQEYEFTKNDEN